MYCVGEQEVRGEGAVRRHRQRVLAGQGPNLPRPTDNRFQVDKKLFLLLFWFGIKYFYYFDIAVRVNQITVLYSIFFCKHFSIVIFI